MLSTWWRVIFYMYGLKFPIDIYISWDLSELLNFQNFTKTNYINNHEWNGGCFFPLKLHKISYFG